MKVKRAEDFKPWELDKMKDEVEQRVLLNGLDVLQAARWMLEREYYRHMQDCLRIKKDLMKLDRLNVQLPPNLRLDLWFEIPNKGVK